MWKSRLFCFLLLTSSFEVNATDYASRWSISGIDNAAELRLDIDVGTFSLAAHGILVLGNGNALPVAGSCFVTSGSGVVCMINTTRGISFEFLIDDYLNGPITEWSTLGQEGQTGTMTFLGL